MANEEVKRILDDMGSTTASVNRPSDAQMTGMESLPYGSRVGSLNISGGQVVDPLSPPLKPYYGPSSGNPNMPDIPQLSADPLSEYQNTITNGVPSAETKPSDETQYGGLKGLWRGIKKGLTFVGESEFARMEREHIQNQAMANVMTDAGAAIGDYVVGGRKQFEEERQARQQGSEKRWGKTTEQMEELGQPKAAVTERKAQEQAKKNAEEKTQQPTEEDLNKPRSDAELQDLWNKYNNPSTPEEKAYAEQILRANATYILGRRKQNREQARFEQTVEGRFIKEQEDRRARQIQEDIKSLGLDPTDQRNWNAMNAVRSMGMTAHDIMRARTEFSRTGRGYEWSQMTLEEKIGHANLYKAKSALGGNNGEGLKGLNYKDRKDEVARVRMLSTLVEKGVITPQELVAGRGLVKQKKGQTTVSVSEVDKIVFRKERELYDATQYAKMRGLEAEAEQSQAKYENLKSYRKYMSQKSEAFARLQEMGETQVTDGISRQSLLLTLDTWYKEREQILKITDDEERKNRLRKNDARLKRWKVSDGDVSIYLQTRKGDIYDRANLGE